MGPATLRKRMVSAARQIKCTALKFPAISNEERAFCFLFGRPSAHGSGWVGFF